MTVVDSANAAKWACCEHCEPYNQNHDGHSSACDFCQEDLEPWKHTLVVGINGEFSHRQTSELRRRMLSLLPAGTNVVIISHCTALTLVPGQGRSGKPNL